MRALYRRYRPLNLADVIGQEQVTTPLINSIKTGNISHAYLFIGPRGCGKTSVARILAHEINGFKYELEDDYVDIIEIDGASNRGIDNIRELRDKVAIAPSNGKYKVYIIDEVHMLTKEAFNALLKTLEEPPSHAVFIMATTDAYKVPVTITSRAQTFTFKLSTPEVMHKYLSKVANKENINISDDALRIIVRLGGGSFRDSMSLLDQISALSDQEITKELVIKAMGLPSDDKISELFEAYTSRDTASAIKIMRELLSSGTKPETLAETMISLIVQEPRAELLPLLARLTDVKAPFAEARLLLAISSNVQSQSAHITPHKPLVQRATTDNNTDTSTPTTEEPVTTAAKTQNIIAANTAFDWKHYLTQIQNQNDAIYSQLTKCKYKYQNGELSLHPQHKITKTILSKPNNRRILVDAANGVKITICEVGSSPNDENQDKTLTTISAIMGGEVRNDGGESPF